MLGDLNMDDLHDARAYFEKEYRAESTLFNGSKIAAGQYRRYADAVAQAAIKLGYQAAGVDLTPQLRESIAIVKERDHYKARCERLEADLDDANEKIGRLTVALNDSKVEIGRYIDLQHKLGYHEYAGTTEVLHALLNVYLEKYGMKDVVQGPSP